MLGRGLAGAGMEPLWILNRAGGGHGFVFAPGDVWPGEALVSRSRHAGPGSRFPFRSPGLLGPEGTVSRFPPRFAAPKSFVTPGSRAHRPVRVLRRCRPGSAWSRRGFLFLPSFWGQGSLLSTLAFGAGGVPFPPWLSGPEDTGLSGIFFFVSSLAVGARGHALAVRVFFLPPWQSGPGDTRWRWGGFFFPPWLPGPGETRCPWHSGPEDTRWRWEGGFFFSSSLAFRARGNALAGCFFFLSTLAFGARGLWKMTAVGQNDTGRDGGGQDGRGIVDLGFDPVKSVGDFLILLGRGAVVECVVQSLVLMYEIFRSYGGGGGGRGRGDRNGDRGRRATGDR